MSFGDPNTFPSKPAPNDPTTLMTKTQGTILIIIGFLILITMIALTLHPVSARYEYIIVSPKDEILETELVKLGEDGWDVIYARRALVGEGAASTGQYEIILRRRSGFFLFIEP